ncbi:OsmC family peroxiredoxin [Agromyces sp. CFH 90414]|uniref:OsmC family peroxiredoxin n=1 Tax=Agromyces agglutinans TaxID=2662258 RepID=A0A6I2F4F1_9MICO|nr:OsmC family protein [Agromyces agglutinans]MRG59482.1 OsmC family peroxiredoxin [Agromyces agglutinans]
MTREHHYAIDLTWTGDDGEGTRTYRGYRRDHVLSAPGLPEIPGSSDPSFRGDPARWNPEQLLVASIAQCHLLWYLHLASTAGVVVTAYEDSPTGTMVEGADGSGSFREVTLRPRVTITADSDPEAAAAAHERVGAFCFIARSVNFPVRHEPVIVVEAAG